MVELVPECDSAFTELEPEVDKLVVATGVAGGAVCVGDGDVVVEKVALGVAVGVALEAALKLYGVVADGELLGVCEGVNVAVCVTSVVGEGVSELVRVGVCVVVPLKVLDAV